MQYVIDSNIKQIMNNQLKYKEETNTKGNTVESEKSKSQSKSNALTKSSQATEDEEEPVLRRKMRK